MLARAARGHVRPDVSVTFMDEPRFFFQDIHEAEEQEGEACRSEGRECLFCVWCVELFVAKAMCFEHESGLPEGRGQHSMVSVLSVTVMRKLHKTIVVWGRFTFSRSERQILAPPWRARESTLRGPSPSPGRRTCARQECDGQICRSRTAIWK